jgi:hypothetical protein
MLLARLHCQRESPFCFRRRSLQLALVMLIGGGIVLVV